MKKIGLAALLCLFLCGCMRGTQLQDRAIVQGLGVDYEDGVYEVTFQVFNPEGSSGNNSFDNTKTNDIVISVKGHTITQAFSEVDTILGKRPFLGNNMYLAVGRKAAEQGFSYVIDFFNSYYETRSTTYVILADEKAADLVSAQIKVGLVPASAVSKIAQESTESGTLPFPNIFELIQAMKTTGKDVAIPIMTVEKDQWDNMLPSVKSVGLLVEGKLVGEMELSEMMGVQLARGKVRSGVVVAEDERLGRIAVVLHDNESRITYRMENGFPVYTLDIQVEGNVNELAGSIDQNVTESDVPAIEELMQQEISAQVVAGLRGSVYRFGTDLLSLGRRLYKYDSRYWEGVKDAWPEAIRQCGFQVLVQVEVENLGPAANVKSYQ